MHMEITGLRLEIEGVKDRKEFRFGTITITLRADCPLELLEKAGAMAKKYCFVTNSLSVPIEVVCRDDQPGPAETA